MSKTNSCSQTKEKSDNVITSHSKVENTYFTNSKLDKNKRMSVSPDYQHSYKSMMKNV